MSIHFKEGVYSKQYCLWNWLLTGNGRVSAKKAVIEVNYRWDRTFKVKDINKTRKLIYTLIKLQ